MSFIKANWGKVHNTSGSSLGTQQTKPSWMKPGADPGEPANEAGAGKLSTVEQISRGLKQPEDPKPAESAQEQAPPAERIARALEKLSGSASISGLSPVDRVARGIKAIA